jgi:hypothetical protein
MQLSMPVVQPTPATHISPMMQARGSSQSALFGTSRQPLGAAPMIGSQVGTVQASPSTLEQAPLLGVCSIVPSGLHLPVVQVNPSSGIGASAYEHSPATQLAVLQFIAAHCEVGGGLVLHVTHALTPPEPATQILPGMQPVLADPTRQGWHLFAVVSH